MIENDSNAVELKISPFIELKKLNENKEWLKTFTKV